MPPVGLCHATIYLRPAFRAASSASIRASIFRTSFLTERQDTAYRLRWNQIDFAKSELRVSGALKKYERESNRRIQQD
jgi:hypothetical protein